MLYNRDENDDEGLSANGRSGVPAGAGLPVPWRIIVHHRTLWNPENRVEYRSPAALAGGGVFSKPLPLSFENSTYKFSPFTDPGCSDMDGGRNAKTRNSFQSTIFLHFSNYKVSMTYK